MNITRRTVISSACASGLAFASQAAFAASPASTFAKIKETGVMRIGVTSAEPWFFHDPMSGEWSGVGVAIGKRLAQDLGVKLLPVETTWGNAIAALQADQIDVMFVLDPTPERRKAIAFPDQPMFYYAMGALSRTGVKVDTWSEIDAGKNKIGVTLGTSLDRSITEMMKQASIDRFANNDEAVAAFAARRVDVVAQFHPALVVQYARLRQGQVSLPKPVTPIATSAGVRIEADPAWREWLGKRFEEYYRDGSTEKDFLDYLKAKHVDPASTPGLIKEKWGA